MLQGLRCEGLGTQHPEPEAIEQLFVAGFLVDFWMKPSIEAEITTSNSLL